MKNEIKTDIAIIGAGPAGIISAIFAKSADLSVVLIDKNPIIGRKILATGNGRCNLTNSNLTIDRFHGGSCEFIKRVIDRFDQEDTISFFNKLGLLLKEEENGRIFPRTNQASSVVRSLEDEINRLGVRVSLGNEIRSVSNDSSGLFIIDSEQFVIRSEKLVLATGGKAAYYLGSSGDGLFWAKQFGHTITPVYAALVPLETIESWPKDVSGIKVEALVSVRNGGKMIASREGDLLFTHFGLSGPAIMGLTREIASLLADQQSVEIEIDLFPDIPSDEVDAKISAIFSSHGAKAVKNSLIGCLPQNLIPIVLKVAQINPDKKSAEVSKVERQFLVKTLKKLPLKAKNLRPLKEAQVTSGGVDLSEIDASTMMSKIVPNLYFAGEILDVDADSGGFNLQWAWSSGYLAGISAGNSKNLEFKI